MTTQNRQPVLRCVLSNAAHPEYGQVTIPFPIPVMEYERTLELLAAMELGARLKRDCRVDELESGFPILKRLEKVGANLDELDYLARRLDGFDDYEAAQFQAMAVRLGTFDMTDFINLTFCGQQATVITDFSDLDAVGRQHYMTLEGGCASEEELEQVDGRAAALKLILNKHGTITPYGVVYDNGMELEKFYKEGGPFPDYTGTATSSYVTGYTVTADYTGTVSRIALNRVRYVAIFEGEPLEPAVPMEGPGDGLAQFNWAAILLPLGVVFAVGGVIGACLFVKRRRESKEEDAE